MGSSHLNMWPKSSESQEELRQTLLRLGVRLDLTDGHLFYAAHFEPFKLQFDLIFVRHGETYGNCGQSTAHGQIDEALVSADIKNPEARIFQGNIDTDINQLTEHGKQQALKVAESLKRDFIDKDFIPDLILSSPLGRAIHTGLPFVKQNKLEANYFIHEDLRELSFGAWENRRVCDQALDDDCHLFYKNQNALVKCSGINNSNIYQEAENFSEVLLRIYHLLQNLNETYNGKKIIMFSHSMVGAALCILLGKGQCVEHALHLAFDGKRADGSTYTIPHTTPIVFNDHRCIHSKSHTFSPS